MKNIDLYCKILVVMKFIIESFKKVGAMIKRYHCVKQHDLTDCGVACLATIAKQYGKATSISKLRHIASTDREGTTIYGLVEAAEKMSFTADAYEADIEDFKEEFPLPAIAHVVIDGGMSHFVVVHKIKKDSVLVADPAKGMVTYSFDEFEKLWTGGLIILTPTVDFNTDQKEETTLKRFVSLVSPQKKLLTQIFLSSLIYTIFGILAAFYFKFLVDDIIPGDLRNSLISISVCILLLLLFKSILGFIRTQMMLLLSQKIDIPLILGYYNHVLDLPMNFFESRQVGEIISRFMDASKIRAAISGATLTIMIDVLMAFSGGLLLYMNNKLLFSIAFGMLVLYILIVLLFNKSVKTYNSKAMVENASLTSYLVESLNGVETVKAFDYQNQCKVKTEEKFIVLLKSVFKLGSVNNMRKSLTVAISSVGGTIIIWAGAVQVMNGSMSLGQLLVFNSLLLYFIEPVQNLIDLHPTLQEAIVASERLSDILNLEGELSNENKQAISHVDLKGDIELNAIDFRYGNADKLFDKLTFKINAGEKVAFVGVSGSGKTTLAKLLLGFYEIEDGDISVGGQAISADNLKALRNRTAYVPQETFLFSDTVYENITLGAEYDYEEVVGLAKEVAAHDFIMKLPQGYTTHINENGANLSGGQRQKLSLVRAFLRQPDLLILDEATSNLDSLSERCITQLIDSRLKDTTTIIIAHRLSTVKNCDRIVCLDGGSICEVGTHQELINKEGYYYKMWSNQYIDI